MADTGICTAHPGRHEIRDGCVQWDGSEETRLREEVLLAGRLLAGVEIARQQAEARTTAAESRAEDAERKLGYRQEEVLRHVSAANQLQIRLTAAESALAEAGKVIDAFKAAAMLDVGSDPDGVTPAHVEREITSLRAALADSRIAAARYRKDLEASCAALAEARGALCEIVTHTDPDRMRVIAYAALARAGEQEAPVVCDHAPNEPHPKDGTVPSRVSRHLCLRPRAGEQETRPCDFMPNASASKDRLDVELSAWPVPDVLERLADAADHLRGDHNCDAQGHEGVLYASQAARAHAKALRASPAPPPREQGKGALTGLALVEDRIREAKMLAQTEPADARRACDAALAELKTLAEQGKGGGEGPVLLWAQGAGPRAEALLASAKRVLEAEQPPPGYRPCPACGGAGYLAPAQPAEHPASGGEEKP